MATREEANEVELGFLEETDSSSQLTSPHFPSKVGGKPAWLDPAHLPSPEQLQCLHCHKPCILLLQIYAPLSDQPETYHRSLFVFMCLDGNCHKEGSSQPFKVLRCHLPQENSYYPNEEAESMSSDKDSFVISSPLCCVCGCLAPNRCGQCLKVHYCSQHHQLIDWKKCHKLICKDLVNDKVAINSFISSPAAGGILLTEYEIVTETEPKCPSSTQEDRLADYTSFINSDDYKKTKLPDDDNDLKNLKSLIKEDKTFSKFKKRVSLEPDQVIRFQPGGDPLLISNDPSQIPSVIPLCGKCQSPRRFEFQIMPQLLYYLKLDSTPSHTSIDWGTLLIYTCSTNCSSTGYTDEFLWKQDPQ